MNKLIIGLMGKAGAGKTVTALALQGIDIRKISILNFAGPLKEAAQGLFLLNDAQLYGKLKDEIDSRWGMTPRRMLQKLGTDCIREIIDPHFWLKRMVMSIDSSPAKVIVIDDVRFQNEAELVLEEGGFNCVIRRDGLTVDDKHPSEQVPVQLAGTFLQNPGDGLKDYCNMVRESAPAEWIRRFLA